MAAFSDPLSFFSSPSAQFTGLPTDSIPLLGPPTRKTPPPVSSPESTSSTPPAVSLPGSIFSTPTSSATDTTTSSPVSPTLPTTPLSSGSPTLSASTNTSAPISSSTPTDPFSSSATSSSVSSAQTSPPIISGTSSTSPIVSFSSSTSLPSTTYPPSSSTSMSTSTSPTSSTSAGALPVSALASHSHHAGAIAGGVIGGVAGLVAIICALLFIRSRLHKRRGVAATSTFRKWDGLSSRESGLAQGYTTHSAGPSAYHTSTPTRHPSTASTAAMLGRKGSIGYGAEYDDEKYPGTAEPSSHGHEPLEYAAPTTAYAYDFPSPMIPATPSAAFVPGRPRDRSHSQSRALALAHLETASQSPPPVTPISPYNFNHSYNRNSLDGRVLASPPMSPSGVQRSESIRMNRTSIGRHPTRKPVPKYDESESVEGDMSPSASPTMSPTQVPSPDTEAARDSVYYDSRGTPSASSSSSNLQGGSSHLHSSVTHAGTSLTAVRSREDLLAAGYHIPKLSEKTSFGDMSNVHYLIPDPPPKAMD